MKTEIMSIRLNRELIDSLDLMPGRTRADRVRYAIKSRAVLTEIVQRMDRIESALASKSAGPDPAEAIEKIQAVLVQLASNGDKTRADMRRGLDAIYKSVAGGTKK